MNRSDTFEGMLTGGHPNSLGNTTEVVAIVLSDRTRFDDLYQCYFSENEVVRLRVSSAMKRICKERPEWFVPYLDKLLSDIARINQASAQWTLAQLFLWLEKYMTASQKEQAIAILQRNLEDSGDWIVQINTVQTLTAWAGEDGQLKNWLMPRLEQFTKDSRKSVAGRARKMLVLLSFAKV